MSKIEVKIPIRKKERSAPVSARVNRDDWEVLLRHHVVISELIRDTIANVAESLRKKEKEGKLK